MKTAILIFLLLLPGMASAEVSDKISSITFLLGQGLILGALSFALCWFRWWFALVFLPMGTLMFWSTADLWWEPHMREAILSEQGMGYFLFLGAVNFIIIFGSVSGAVLDVRHRRSTRCSSQGRR